MKYVLLICDDESVSPTQRGVGGRPGASGLGGGPGAAWRRGCSARGCGRSRDATTVRVRQGETLVSDGPFAETKDFVGGVVVVECADLDEAIAIAAGHPYAHWGSVEIRPVWE